MELTNSCFESPTKQLRSYHAFALSRCSIPSEHRFHPFSCASRAALPENPVCVKIMAVALALSTNSMVTSVFPGPSTPGMGSHPHSQVNASLLGDLYSPYVPWKWKTSVSFPLLTTLQ